ncbi:MAG: TIGR00282 family metallophosphoesterase [Planctomycetota bacterium]|jgi:metallophosphoesterase (TIGR00282 family)
MATITIAFLGDIFGAPGRMVVRERLPWLCRQYQPDVVIANAENARAGSGLTPELYHKIRDYGVDAVTLGDHIYRDRKIISILEQPDEPIARPANLSEKAIGRPYTRLPPQGRRTKSVFIITVLGRVFFPLPADDPFAAVDRLLPQLPEPDPVVIVEAHMEATSEKAALAHHLDGRVTAVLGTHTHVPTADARVLKGGTGFITDVGMCGPYDSIIGLETQSVLQSMTTSQYIRRAVGSGAETLWGVVIKVNEANGRTLSIKQVHYAADVDV